MLCLTVRTLHVTPFYYASDDVWGKVLLLYTNVFLKYMNRKWWMLRFWEPRIDGEYFKLCKILTEFPDKFREQ